ncbi:hypothetical protein niasHT_038658 [Heterodera trifolii]|uniref:Uncharacterized protein n=1 Tax=Heterodera trifolii TaxID=157864 RepID=A0ABD2HPI7_9BILA
MKFFNCNITVFLGILALTGICKFGTIASPVQNEEEEIKNAQPSIEIGESSSKASGESKEKEPKAETASTKMPMDYDLHRVAAKAAGNVYGSLPADKQPKKLADIKRAAPLPPADYDVERVAEKAAESVYSWLPKELQPEIMTEDERVEYTAEVFQSI